MYKKSWPKFPKVVVEGNQIVIHFEDGTMQYWGVEDCEEERLLIASDIQNGLSAIHFITDLLDSSISDCFNVLKRKGYEDKQVEEYLRDALQNVMCKRSSKEIKIRDESKADICQFYIS
jgi:hypothetical protein